MSSIKRRTAIIVTVIGATLSAAAPALALPPGPCTPGHTLPPDPCALARC